MAGRYCTRIQKFFPNNKDKILRGKSLKQIGDYLYTIHESNQTVRPWKIQEINGDLYRCESKGKRTYSIREFSKDDSDIFDTKEDAMKVIRQTKRKKNLIFTGYFLFIAFIAVIIVIFKILTGTF